MKFFNTKHMRHKVLSIVSTPDCILVRILTPALSALRSITLNEILQPNICKGREVVIENKTFMCAHEIYLDKSHPLWKGGNHIIFYTTPDLFANRLIAVGLKENIQNIPGVCILTELLCCNSKQNIDEADLLINIDPKGQVYCNNPENVSDIPKEGFCFLSELKVPNSVKQNSIFPISVEMKTSTGKNVTGSIIVDSLAGYIPNRVVQINNGKGQFNCCALLVDKHVHFKLNGLEAFVEVTDD